MGEAVVRIFPSSQVRVRDKKPKEYYEVLPQDIPLMCSTEYRATKLQTEANIVSFNNQKLEVGDVVFSARNKLGNIEIITQEILSYGIFVVKNGNIIIRTGDCIKAASVQQFLNMEDIKEYVDDHSKPKEKTKVRTIHTDLISSLPFPILTSESHTTFRDCTAVIDRTTQKIELFSKKIKKLSELNKIHACKKDMNNVDNYNLNLWNALEQEFDDLLESVEMVKLSEKLEDI